MNKRIAILSTMIAMAVFSFILFALSYGKEGIFATAVPTQRMEYLPTLTTQTAPVSSVSRDALQKYANADIETQTRNGIEMSASNFRVEGNLLKVNICFTNPDNQEWSIGESNIQIGDEQVLPLGGSALEVSRSLGDKSGEITVMSGANINVEKTNYSVPNYRCDTLLFAVNTVQRVYSGTASLTIKNVHIIPKNGCDVMKMIQSILDERKLGIKIACTETGSNGLYNAEIQVLEKPQGMSEEQAQQYIAEARREATTIDGPWVFEGTVTGAGNP